ncbi:MAG: response regulator transcription factor [Ferruginibacter sp.]|nr:response regulator transcription factor [Ferruginibacter sp.]
MIKIYIVEDHSVVIEGIYSLLQNEKGIQVVGYAINASNCINYFTTNTADVILMDIGLPDMSGIDLCTLIKKKYPGIMVIALSTFNQGTYINKMMAAGANGYLLKNTNKIEMLEAIKIVAEGKIYLSFDADKELQLTKNETHKLPLLTKREKEILLLISEGLTNQQIKEKLFISIDTVDTHRKNLHTKLNVKNTAMLIKYAVQHNLL